MGEPSAPGQRVEEEGSGICWEQNTAPKPLEESPTEGVLVPGLTGALALLQRGFLSAKEISVSKGEIQQEIQESALLHPQEFLPGEVQQQLELCRGGTMR